MTGVTNYTEVYRFAGPGAVIPVREWPPVILESTANGFDVHAVLNTIGSAVEEQLEWRWPPPYDAEQRRAAVRIKRKTRALEVLVQQVTPLEILHDSRTPPLWHARRAFPGPR